MKRNEPKPRATDVSAKDRKAIHAQRMAGLGRFSFRVGQFGRMIFDGDPDPANAVRTTSCDIDWDAVEADNKKFRKK